MLKFIEGDHLPAEFHRLISEATRTDIAVAFWGKGAARMLNIPKNGSARVIRDLQSGACHPAEIRKLRSLIGSARVRQHNDLHAKVYLTDRAAIVGSSNASTNGLAMTEDDAARWREANVVLDKQATVKCISRWFERPGNKHGK